VGGGQCGIRTLYCWCQYAGSTGGWWAHAGGGARWRGQTGSIDGGGGGASTPVGWPQTCSGRQNGGGCPGWCAIAAAAWACGIVPGGGNPMVGTTHGAPPAAASFLGPPAAAYICRFCVQLAASASRAIRCFLCDRYFCNCT
jgi:hypothetical protein